MNKAPDIYGLTSEHITLADPIIISTLKAILHQAYRNRQFPGPLKLGAVTPVCKKGKSPACPDSYRRITVTPILGKIVEKSMLKDSRPKMDSKQNKMQRGFSTNASSVNAALMVTEAIADAKDNKQPLFLQFLDAKKAFDVVWHTGLKCSLHSQGITGRVWEMYDSLYTDISSSIKWLGKLSPTFIDHQGLRQGGDTSADTFKTKTNPMLDSLEDSGEGYSIGTTSLSAPTCADDTTLISSTLTGAKILLAIAERDSNNNRYSFSSTKSKIMLANPTTTTKEQLALDPPSLYGEELPVSTQETHLGILRVPDDRARATVQARITTSRRALFAMTGAGLYGFNGLNPIISKQLVDIYILPKLLHSLEAMMLPDSDIQSLETFYRTTLRQLQHLPKNTAKPAIYLLIGALPAEGHLHLRVLSLFMRILNQTTSAEYQIVKRQLIMKDITSHSWVITVRKVLFQYKLPSPFKLLDEPRKKNQWKSVCKSAVHEYWTNKLKEEACKMVTLKYLSVNFCSTDKPHYSYSLPTTDPMLVTQATVKCKFLVQRYPLTATYSAGKNRSHVCPICSIEPEDLHHFLFDCEPIHQDTDTYIEQLQAVIRKKHLLFPPLSASSKDWYTQLILDARTLTGDEEVYRPIEAIARKMMFKLHHRRAVLLGGGSRYTWARSRGNLSKLG